MIMKEICGDCEMYVTEFSETNSFPTGLLLRVCSDLELLENKDIFIKTKDSVAIICDRKGNIPHRDISFFFKEDEEIINIVGFYLNLVSQFFDSVMLGKVLNELKSILGKPIYISKDSVNLNRRVGGISEKALQEIIYVLDNIPNINKVSDIGWVYE